MDTCDGDRVEWFSVRRGEAASVATIHQISRADMDVCSGCLCVAACFEEKIFLFVCLCLSKPRELYLSGCVGPSFFLLILAVSMNFLVSASKLYPFEAQFWLSMKASLYLLVYVSTWCLTVYANMNRWVSGM